MTGGAPLSIAGVLTNVILNALLIPRWDIAGAAIATGTSLILWNVLLVILVRRRLGVDATAIGRTRQPFPRNAKAHTL